MHDQGQLREKVYSLYLGLRDDESKIWLGGYDRSTIRFILSRVQKSTTPSPALTETADVSEESAPVLDEPDSLTKPASELTDEELDQQIRWLDLVSPYYWMTSLDSAFIDGTDWSITVDSIIFDSGSSINHIPTREYNVLLNYIMREHSCITIMNPLETYYCDCTGEDDASFPQLSI